MSLPSPSYNDDPKSFAHPTVHKRWPAIITSGIEDLEKHAKSNPDAKGCTEFVIGNLQALLEDFKADKPVKAFSDEDIKLKPELEVYNRGLQKFNDEKLVTWLTGPWLYLECYLYQLINVWFLNTKKLQKFDIFESAKVDAFKQSGFGVIELCQRVKLLSQQLNEKEAEEQALELLFTEFIDISLWGNATDLSLLAGNVSLQDIKSLQGAEVRKKNEEKIIVNDTQKAWKHYLSSSRERIDIVLDNSGFELFADLCLTLFLLEAKLVKNVVLHCKQIPWFVSDTMPKDFDLLLAQLGDEQFFDDLRRDDSAKEAVTFLLEKLKFYAGKKQITTQAHEFWTSCENYWVIPHQKDLYEELKKSNLIIFKGDLNYRKLTGDLHWDTTTPFTKAIQDLASSGLPILSLRTCKADVVVGLPAGLNEKLIEEYKSQGNEIGEFWTASGKWAVISFNQS
ncbi:hypothetical protein FT663_02906 [Candidozyma haemuli var. vulneris]|uniref:Sugar phosphate phosphatase n=1 Tax=Candidozyma haemuli TaxID=45357 RepID=A0A2V1AVA8_9ASCO|nr:hypothetical protein CXQ85_000701 [[Candida] haemuloni]KAF3989205.1 hypothetical protein FT662_02948 [[Candida] haemuloni var. vulneris]KAF3991121.1 hypothetical protein FT663_02906 [[Candida] haemuloni var. vulneris]PVH21712.1 hypothetical protein CXQ85_000701 [[Candida] haemuloni]